MNDDNSATTLKSNWFNCIIPLLNEYFFGEWDKLIEILGLEKDSSKGFIKQTEAKNILKNSELADDSLYEFKTAEEFTESDFIAAIKALKTN